MTPSPASRVIMRTPAVLARAAVAMLVRDGATVGVMVGAAVAGALVYLSARSDSAPAVSGEAVDAKRAIAHSQRLRARGLALRTWP